MFLVLGIRMQPRIRRNISDPEMPHGAVRAGRRGFKFSSAGEADVPQGVTATQGEPNNAQLQAYC